MHIEGALSPEVLFQLSEENGVPLDPKYYSTPEALKERYRHFTGLDDFLVRLYSLHQLDLPSTQ